LRAKHNGPRTLRTDNSDVNDLVPPPPSPPSLATFIASRYTC
jgi:hypothetical protein